MNLVSGESRVVSCESCDIKPLAGLKGRPVRIGQGNELAVLDRDTLEANLVRMLALWDRSGGWLTPARSCPSGKELGCP